MRQLAIYALLTICVMNVYSQRYISPIFSNVNVYNDLTYGAAVNIQQNLQILKLDFYEPAGDTFSKRPLVIYIHGGGFSDTSQTKSLPHIVAFCDSLAKRGYATASINYRLDSANTGLSNRAIINAAHDAKAAIRFFKSYPSIFKIDTSLIFIGGESAGAITAMNAAYINLSSEVLYPLTPPFNGNLTVNGNSGNPGMSERVKGVMCFCGGTRHVSTLPIFDTSAINVSSDPPILMTHGTADPLVPLQYSLEIALRANHLGLPYLYYPFYGATHCPWGIGLPNSWQYLDSLIDYTIPFLYAGIAASLNEENKSKKDDAIQFYPNPVHEVLHVKAEQSIEPNSKVEIFDVLGQLRYSILLNSMGKIDLKDLPKGVYLLKTKYLKYPVKLLKD
jgi:acetyl esterase/lipase